MAKHILTIRETDWRIFELIKVGKKTIDTRAATDKYQRIRAGDILVFKCGKDRLEKVVVKVHHLRDIKDLIQSLDLRKIMPFVSSIRQAKQIWYSFPNYREKIKRYGLVAFEIH